MNEMIAQLYYHTTATLPLFGCVGLERSTCDGAPLVLRNMAPRRRRGIHALWSVSVIHRDSDGTLNTPPFLLWQRTPQTRGHKTTFALAIPLACFEELGEPYSFLSYTRASSVTRVLGTPFALFISYDICANHVQQHRFATQ